MEMKVSTVSVNAAPVKQGAAASSSDSGFSEILSGVRAASTAGQPGTFTADRSGTFTAGQSGASAAGQSGAFTAGQSGASAAGQPGASAAGQSGASAAGQPGTSRTGQPGTSGTGQQSDTAQQGTVRGSQQTGGAQKADNAQQTDGVQQSGAADQTDSGAAASAQDPQGQENGTAQNGQEVTAQIEYGEISLKLEGKVAELVWKLAEDSEKTKDEIIRALLDYLKKLQQKGDDKAVSVVMQILTALRAEQQAPSMELHVTVQNMSAEISAVSAEFSSVPTQQAISPEMPQAASDPIEANVQPVTDGTADIPEMHSQGLQGQPEAKPQSRTEAAAAENTEEVPETGTSPEEALPEIRAQAQAPEQYLQEQPASAFQTPAENGRPVHTAQQEAPETAQAAQMPAESAESMLNDILAMAREELGLVKAEFTRTNADNTQGTAPASENAQPQNVNVQPLQAQAVQPETALAREKADTPETVIRPQQSEQPEHTEQPEQLLAKPAMLKLQPNHRDGRDELDSILGGQDKKSDNTRKIAVPEQGADSAALTGSGLNRETAPIRNELPQPVIAPPERQLADEILSRAESLNGGRTEFTMVLNPENLGRITVKMASTGGRIEVSITAENDATRQLLESRTEQLGTALRQNGVELERYQVVSGQENAQLMQDNYDGSSKNPYGRPDDEDGEKTDEDMGNEFLEILQQI